MDPERFWRIPWGLLGIFKVFDGKRMIFLSRRCEGFGAVSWWSWSWFEILGDSLAVPGDPFEVFVTLVDWISKCWLKSRHNFQNSLSLFSMAEDPAGFPGILFWGQSEWRRIGLDLVSFWLSRDPFGIVQDFLAAFLRIMMEILPSFSGTLRGYWGFLWSFGLEKRDRILSSSSFMCVGVSVCRCVDISSGDQFSRVHEPVDWSDGSSSTRRWNVVRGSMWDARGSLQDSVRSWAVSGLNDVVLDWIGLDWVVLRNARLTWLLLHVTPLCNTFLGFFRGSSAVV